MTVKEFLDVVAGGARVFIKPSARGLYYDGIAAEVPLSLMSAIIQEVSPRICEEDISSINRYRGQFGIWVHNIPEFDALYAGIEDYEDFDGKSIDSFYCFLMENHDQRMKELWELAEQRNVIKSSLTDYKIRLSWPNATSKPEISTDEDLREQLEKLTEDAEAFIDLEDLIVDDGEE